MDKLSKRLYPIGILTAIYCILSFFLFAKSGNMLIDFSRETNIPFQLNQGQNLLKDIFLIYGYFGYALNAFLYKIYPNINILLLEANLISYIILISFYYTIKNFFNTKKALILALFFIITSIFSNSSFNLVVPYSYPTIWAILGIYLVLFSILYKKNILLFISLGLISVNKFELFLLTFIVTISYLLYKKISFKKEFILLFIFPCLYLIYLKANNISLFDIIQNANHIKAMIKTDAINTLYKSTGTFFEIKYFLYNIKQTIYLFLSSTISYILFKKNHKISSLIIICILFAMLDINKAANLFGIISILLAFYLNFKNSLKTKELMLLIFSIILCSKNFFAINSVSYANFGYILILSANLIFLSKIFNKKQIFNIFVIFLTILNIQNIIYNLQNKKTSFKTPYGLIQLNKDDEKIFKETYNFITNNTTSKDSLLVIPEGQIFNFITQRKYDFYNTTFIPLDFETFGEEHLIEELKAKKTDYIILYPRNTIDYGSATICYDYAENFCEYIADNYERIKIIEDKYKVLIFKIRKK